MQGWIKLHRKIENRGRYTDANTSRLFFHCIIKANHKAGVWKGIEIPAGSFITSSIKLGLELGLSRQQIRASLVNLQNTQEITIKTTNKYTMINIVNYSGFQGGDDEVQPAKQPTNNQQTNQQTTTNNNNKNIKNEKNNKNIYPENFSEFWKIYPHARGGKKNEAYESFKKNKEEEIMETVKIYAEEVKLGLQDTKYVPACERRTKNFAYSEHVNRTRVVGICEKMIASETPTEDKRRFASEFEKYNVPLIFKEIRNRKSDLLINSIINAQ